MKPFFTIKNSYDWTVFCKFLTVQSIVLCHIHDAYTTFLNNAEIQWKIRVSLYKDLGKT